VVETIPAALKEKEAKAKEGQPGLGQYSVLGMAVLFVFLSAPTTALSFFKEKRQGSFRRLIAAPVSKASLLAGKLLPNLILCLVQIVVIFIAGGFAIQLLGVKPLDLSGDPLGLVVVSLAVALCATSLGIFLAAIAKTEGQLSGLGSLLLFMTALLAGSFIPLFMFPAGLENMARMVPQYWANQAFYGLIFRGQTLVDVWPSIAALLAFTLAFFGIGLWRFKFD
jgi:ABC-2 type transport system permease protein